MKTKKFRNMLSLFFSLLIVTTSTISFTVSAESDELTNGELLEQAYEKTLREEKLSENIISAQDKVIINNQTESKKEYNKLIADVYNKGINKYNDYYAGSYMDDNGELVVKVTENSSEIVDEIESVTDNENINIKTANFSYNELNEINDLISKKMLQKSDNSTLLSEKEKEIIEFISSTRISQEQNKVIVAIKEISNDKIAAFKKYITASTAVTFEQGYDNANSATGMHLGRKILVGDGCYSIGCRAEALKDGKLVRGFITAGHNNRVHDKVYYFVGSVPVEIGKVIARRFRGFVDAAFVQVTNSDYVTTRRVYVSNGDLLRDGCSASPAEGEYVIKCGYASLKRLGKVLSTNHTVYFTKSGVTLSRLYLTTYRTALGDSGGIVYTYDDKVTAGITIGYSLDPKYVDDDGLYTRSYYVDQYYLFSQWGGLTDIFLY